MASKVSSVRVIGPLAGEADGFRQLLLARGYTPLSAANQLRVLAHLSRWLDSQGWPAAELTPARIAEFLAARRAVGYTCWLSPRGLAPLLDYLRSRDLVPPAEPRLVSTPTEELLGQYCAYLTRERGLMLSTVANHERVARLFLTERCRAQRGELALDALSAADVIGFVSAQCLGRSVGTAKMVVTGLRSLLGFLHLTGRLPGALACAVPAVAGWRGGALPQALPAAQVRRLLASCDRRRTTGRRDFAILLLLVRLGLRAGEVAALQLEDLDWRAGQLLVRGKGRRDERLPLPHDVGEAIVSYLRRRKADRDERHVFLRARAPHGPIRTSVVTAVVHQACDRAGLPRVGAHRLRHTAATEMLRAGAPLTEIGQVLRHRSLSTTAIYAKVDRAALRDLALPWPGGA